MDIAVIGGEEFTLGFRLAGISKVISIPEEADQAKSFRSLLDDRSNAIIVTDLRTMGRLDSRTRDDANAAVQPVVVVLSTENSQESLRKLIQKSIGVDLWKE